MEHKRSQHEPSFFKNNWFIILFCLFTITAFNFFARKSFTHQDLDYLHISKWGVNAILFRNFGDQLPIWFLWLKVYTSIFGDSQFALRIMSLVIVLVSAFVLSRLAKSYNLNPFIITALFLFNPLLLQDVFFGIKHWSFLIMTCLLTLYFFEKLKGAGQKRSLALLILTIILGMYSNLIYLIYVGLFASYVVIHTKKNTITFTQGSSILLSIVVFAIPLLSRYSKARHQLFEVQSSQVKPSVASMSSSQYILEAMGMITGANYLPQFFTIILFLVVLILVTISLSVDSKSRLTRIWLLLTFVCTLLVMTALSAETPIRWRYMGFIVPLMYLSILPPTTKTFLIKLGIQTDRIRKLAHLPHIFLQITLLILTFSSSIVMATNYKPLDWKGAASFIKPKIKDDTQVILSFRWAGAFTLEYYLKNPVKRVRNFIDTSYITSHDVWIVRRHGADDRIYKRFYKSYAITIYENVEGFRLIHLARETPQNVKSLIKLTSRIEIDKNGRRTICQFRNGSIGRDCYSYNWEKIHIRRLTAGGENRVCLYLHPRNHTRISLFYKNIRLKNSLKFFTGITDRRVSDRYSPVYIDVFVDRNFVDRVIQIDKSGWHQKLVDTSDYFGRKTDVTFVVYADNDVRRHFGFDAVISEEQTPHDVFYQDLPNAVAIIEDRPCEFYSRAPIWPHNEKEPPFLDSKIFERWDCEDNPIKIKRIWNTVGRSYAVAGDEFREAIWLHPVFNRTKSLRYDNLNIAAKNLIGYYGLSDHALTRINKVRLTYTVIINGVVAYEDNYFPKNGWKEFSIPLERPLDSVEFAISTTNANWNHFFFNAFIDK